MKTALILCLSVFYFCFPGTQPYNWQQCDAATGPPVRVLWALPGGGWDNLRNLDMGPVMNFSYSQCQSTPDRQYLIPDQVFVLPRRDTRVETTSEKIDSWIREMGLTSSSINAEGSFSSVLNGKFSSENREMKEHQVHYLATTYRVQVRNFIYSVKAYPDFNLDFRFVQQVKDIAEATENNQTKNAAYLSEKMVVDFGTHVITSIDSGAILLQEDYLSTKNMSDLRDDNSGISVEAQAGYNFLGLFNLGSSIGYESQKNESFLKDYKSNIKHSFTQSYGGIPFYPGISLQNWQESIRDNLVATDRSGIPLHYVINSRTIPDLPPFTVRRVAQSVRQAIDLYYDVNTRPGCVDVNSKNFNFQANVDDGSCEGPPTNTSFGGVYQECVNISSESDAGPLCEKLVQKNSDTGDFSCHPPYVAILLRSEVRHEGFTLYQCHKESQYIFFSKQVCEDKYYVRSAQVNTYWCSVNGKAPDNSGYLFGGFYSPTVVNPITNSENCPPDFIAVRFLSDGIMICVSRSYGSASRSAVPFGGLFSCDSGNPLANDQRRCPPNFSQHLATVSDGCEIHYCVRSRLFTGGKLLPIDPPPYTNPPIVTMQATNTVMVMTEGERAWVRGPNTSEWKQTTLDKMQDVVKNVSSEQTMAQKKTGQSPWLYVSLTLMVILVLIIVVWVVKKKTLSEPNHVATFRSFR